MPKKSRIEKYPDHETFHYFNANPKNRLTSDCYLRAICTALEQNWQDTLMEMVQFICETGYAINDIKLIEKYITKKGWIKHSQPRKGDNTKYNGKEFCQMIADKKKRYIANIGGHHIVAIVDGKVNDIWDNTKKCIGNYWTKV